MGKDSGQVKSCSQGASGEEAKLEGGGSENTAAILRTSQHFCVLPAFLCSFSSPPSCLHVLLPSFSGLGFLFSLAISRTEVGPEHGHFLLGFGEHLGKQHLDKHRVSRWLSRVNVLCCCEGNGCCDTIVLSYRLMWMQVNATLKQDFSSLW